MFCQVCGSRLSEGGVACESCGAAVKGDAPAERAAPVAVAEPTFGTMPGPSCGEHPGMPLLGNCPRCGKQVCVRCAPDAVHDSFTCTECYGLSEAHKLAPQGAVCAVHPEARAVFVCSRCGSFACATCKPLNDTLGRCVRCAGPLGAMATRGDRFVAAFVDNLVVYLPAIIGFVGVAMAVDGAQGGRKGDLLVLGMFGALAVGVFLGCGAELWAQLTWGQSIGKRLTGIKVVRRDGSAVELWRLVLLRNLVVAVLGNLCGIIPLVDILMIFGQEQRCLHDLLADTIVVDVPTAKG